MKWLNQIEIIWGRAIGTESEQNMERVQRLTQTQISELTQIINYNKSSFAEGKRAQAILMLNRNTEYNDIQMFTGYSHRHVFTLRKTYLTKGLVAIKDK